MKDEKRIIILIIVLLLTIFYLPNIIREIKKDSDFMGGDIIPYSFTAREKKSNEITLSDSYEAVIKILGEPSTIAKEQKMFDINPVLTEGCQFMIYDDFVILIKKNRVSGWCFDLKKVDDRAKFFYLPKLEMQPEKTSFLDFYKDWKNIDKYTYSKILYDLGECHLGNMYFCASWSLGDPSKADHMMVRFYSNEYKLDQTYILGKETLDSKLIVADDVNLISNIENYGELLLGKDISFARKYFSNINIKRQGTKVNSDWEKITYISFYTKDGGTYYSLEFNNLGKCYYFGVSYP